MAIRSACIPKAPESALYPIMRKVKPKHVRKIRAAAKRRGFIDLAVNLKYDEPRSQSTRFPCRLLIHRKQHTHLVGRLKAQRLVQRPAVIAGMQDHHADGSGPAPLEGRFRQLAGPPLAAVVRPGVDI